MAVPQTVASKSHRFAREAMVGVSRATIYAYLPEARTRAQQAS
jgi:hypothetical protein